MALAAALTPMAGCTGGDRGDDGDPGARSTVSPASPAPTIDPRFAQAQELLDRRAAAVLDGDLVAFLADVDDRDPVVVREQRRWFRNLQRLPVQTLSYTVGQEEWDPSAAAEPLRDEPDLFLPQVEVRLQLRTFDQVPVRRVVGVGLVENDGGLVLRDDDAVPEQRTAALGAAPWDLTSLVVRRRPGVLLLLDPRSRSQGAELVQAVAQGIATVQSHVPSSWDGDVVVYATSDPAPIAAVENVPGGDVSRVGGLSFPVYGRPGGTIAAFRFALNPDVLDADPLYLRRLITHELTHVALRRRDDHVPTWLAEGVAEYVSAADLGFDETRIATSVLTRARSTGASGLPPSASFNSGDSDWHYGLSWYACEWIAQTYGEARLWDLVRAMHADGGTPDSEQDAVLRRVVGVGGDRLADDAVALILQTYGA